MEVNYYATIRGNKPVEKIFNKLSESAASAIAAVIDIIEVSGLDDPMVDTRHIHNKLWEIKVGGYRIFYTVVTGPQMILLHAVKKQGKKARKEALDTADYRLAQLIS